MVILFQIQQFNPTTHCCKFPKRKNFLEYGCDEKSNQQFSSLAIYT